MADPRPTGGLLALMDENLSEEKRQQVAKELQELMMEGNRLAVRELVSERIPSKRHPNVSEHLSRRRRIHYELYARFVGPHRRASLSDAAEWLFSAVATGIIGGAAWDALKAAVAKLRRGDDGDIATVVSPAYYEAIRQRENNGAPARPKLTEAMTRELRQLPAGGVPALWSKAVRPEGDDDELLLSVASAMFEEAAYARLEHDDPSWATQTDPPPQAATPEPRANKAKARKARTRATRSKKARAK